MVAASMMFLRSVPSMKYFTPSASVSTSTFFNSARVWMPPESLPALGSVRANALIWPAEMRRRKSLWASARRSSSAMTASARGRSESSVSSDFWSSLLNATRSVRRPARPASMKCERKSLAMARSIGFLPMSAFTFSPRAVKTFFTLSASGDSSMRRMRVISDLRSETRDALDRNSCRSALARGRS